MTDEHWHMDMTKETAALLQTKEFLHYKKLQMQKHVQERVDARVNDMSWDHWKQIVACGLPLKQDDDDPPAKKTQHAKYASVAAAATNCNPRVPAPAPLVKTPQKARKYNAKKPIDETYLDGDSESPSKCVKSMSRKRGPTPTRTPKADPPPKRHSPEGAAMAHAEPLPVARQLLYTNGPLTGTVPRSVPQTIVQLWNRLDVSERPNTATCACCRCPFTTGPPMHRRYNLMLALVNLENYLYYSS